MFFAVSLLTLKQFQLPRNSVYKIKPMWIEHSYSTRHHQHKNKKTSNIINRHQPWSNKQNLLASPSNTNIIKYRWVKHHQTKPWKIIKHDCLLSKGTFLSVLPSTFFQKILSITPQKTNMEPQNRGGWKMIFLFHQGIFSFQPWNFSGEWAMVQLPTIFAGQAATRHFGTWRRQHLDGNMDQTWHHNTPHQSPWCPPPKKKDKSAARNASFILLGFFFEVL